MGPPYHSDRKASCPLAHPSVPMLCGRAACGLVLWRIATVSCTAASGARYLSDAESRSLSFDACNAIVNFPDAWQSGSDSIYEMEVAIPDWQPGGLVHVSFGS